MFFLHWRIIPAEWRACFTFHDALSPTATTRIETPPEAFAAVFPEAQ
jgi:hypothetical protein